MFTENSEEFIQNSSIGIHTVSPEGYILYANQYELESLGYKKEEYIGHHISEFQVDEICLAEILERLSRFEALKHLPAKVISKTGIKHIIYNSSLHEKDGEGLHTRFYGTEVDVSIYEAYFAQYFRKS